jgi:predicted dinucleotide-utilizing enzyme
LDVSSPSAKNLLEQHQSLVANIPDGQGKADWHRQMASLRSRIHDSIRNESASIESASNQLIQQRQQKSLGASREYSFAVFAESDITSRLKKVVSQAIGPASDAVGK